MGWYGGVLVPLGLGQAEPAQPRGRHLRDVGLRGLCAGGAQFQHPLRRPPWHFCGASGHENAQVHRGPPPGQFPTTAGNWLISIFSNVQNLLPESRIPTSPSLPVISAPSCGYSFPFWSAPERQRAKEKQMAPIPVFSPNPCTPTPTYISFEFAQGLSQPEGFG